MKTQFQVIIGLVLLNSFIAMAADKHPLGVRPDCSEKPVSTKEIEDLAKIENVKSINDFVSKLPKDSFQTFTLVTNSKSSQRCEGPGMVSDEWPRVLRTSADGKITMSYTCNPQSCSYNQVEIIYYDDKGQQLKTMSVDLNKKPKERVEHNSGKCLSCHAVIMPNGSKSIKPIWPEYFQWGGCKGSNTINVYGSNDDSMSQSEFRYGYDKNGEYRGCSQQGIVDRQRLEVESFRNFKAKNMGTGANNNPCYSSLPWAKPTGDKGGQYDPAKYENYPYFSRKSDVRGGGNSDGFENYYLRPNLKLTEMYARLNAKRIAGIVEKSPNFPRARYFISLEAAGCLEQEDEAEINRLMPKMKYQHNDKRITGTSYSDPRLSSPFLYAYTQSIGMTGADWTLEYQGKDPRYNAAIPRKGKNESGMAGSDTGMGEILGGEILSKVAKDSPDINKNSQGALTRGVSEGFGPQWSCLDDMGGAIRESHQGSGEPLCKSIRNELNKYLKVALPDCEPGEIHASEKLAKNTQLIIGAINKEKAKKGAKIVAEKCMHCHQAGDPSVPDSIGFFENPKSPLSAPKRAQVKAMSKANLVPSVDAYLKDGTMPADGNKLGDEDREAVLQYIEDTQRN